MRAAFSEPARNDTTCEIRLGTASWDDGSGTAKSVKYTWFVGKNRKAARGGEFPVEALPQALDFAIRTGYVRLSYDSQRAMIQDGSPYLLVDSEIARVPSHVGVFQIWQGDRCVHVDESILRTGVQTAKGRFPGGDALLACDEFGRQRPIPDRREASYSIWALTGRCNRRGNAAAVTPLPLGLGHLAYEKVIADHKGIQVVIIVAIAALGCDAVYQFGQTRQAVVEKAATQSASNSYVDEASTDDTPDPVIATR
jgi:hypothetical protein